MNDSTLIFRLCDEDEDEPLDLDQLAYEPAGDRSLVAGRPVSHETRPCGLDAIARAARALAARADQLVCSAHRRTPALGAHVGDAAGGVVLPSQLGGPIEMDSRADDRTHAESFDEAHAESDTAPADSAFLFTYRPEDDECAGSPIEDDGAFAPSVAHTASRKTRLATPRRIFALGGIVAVWLLVVGLAHGSHAPQPVTDSRPSASTAPAHETASAVPSSSGRRSAPPPPAARPRESRPAAPRAIPQRHRSYAPASDLNPTPAPAASRPLPHHVSRHEGLPHGLGVARCSWRSTVLREVAQHGEPARRADFLHASRDVPAVQHEHRLASLRPAAATLSVHARPAYIDVDVVGRWHFHRRDVRHHRRPRQRPHHSRTRQDRRRRARDRPRDDAGRHRPERAVIQRHRHRRPARQSGRVRTKRGADPDALGASSARKARERVRDGRRDETRRRPPVGSLHRRRHRALPARRADGVRAFGEPQRATRPALHHRHRSRQER
jgi:hypothetical protein